eukprot:16434110-Heterocapsa_arctica.AAC.1
MPSFLFPGRLPSRGPLRPWTPGAAASSDLRYGSSGPPPPRLPWPAPCPVLLRPVLAIAPALPRVRSPPGGPELRSG